MDVGPKRARRKQSQKAGGDWQRLEFVSPAKYRNFTSSPEVESSLANCASASSSANTSEHQGRRLQRLAGFFLRQFNHGQFSQLVIDQWQKLSGSLWIAGINLRKDARHATHANKVHSCGTIATNY
jgi:hypothetical protein